MTIMNLCILAFVLISGIGSGTVDSGNLSPFLPHGLTGVWEGAGLVFFAYLGFDMVSCLSEEGTNPQRNVPLGIIGSLLISMAIYTSVSIVVVGMAPTSLLGEHVPISNALLANACCTQDQLVAPNAEEICLAKSCSPVLRPLLFHGSRLISGGAIFGLTTATFTCLMGQPRIFYRMAQDGLLMEIFRKIDPKTQLPSAGTVISGLIVAFFAGFVDLEVLANIISLGTLQVFTFVNAGVILLRMRPTRQEIDTTNNELRQHSFELSLRSQSSLENDFGSRSTLPRDQIDYFLNYLWDIMLPLTSSKPILLMFLFTMSILIFSFSVNHGWNVLLCASVITALLSFTLLFTLPKSPPPSTFNCPCVPLVPLLGIACNTYMMGSLPKSTWLSTLLWLFCGWMVYLCYGIKHSRLRKLSGEKSITKDDTVTETSPLFGKT